MRATIPVMVISILLSSAVGLAQTKPTAPVTDGLVLWLKADQGLKTDGSIWMDKSGKGHKATALSGRAPKYVPRAFNSLPVARFHGAQAMRIKGAVVSSQTFTIIAVITDTSKKSDGNSRDIISNWDFSNTTTSIFFGTLWRNVTGTLIDRIRFTDAVGGSDQGQTGVGELGHPSTPSVISGVSSQRNAVVRVGSKVLYQLGSALPTRKLSTAWYLGVQGTLAAEYWVGDIAEILVYDKALDNAALGADIAYLQQKWK